LCALSGISAAWRTASAANATCVREIGADQVIDYDMADFKLANGR
jgi:hypothetical protein